MKTLFFLVFIAVFAALGSVEAATVYNEISVKASTGRNSVSPGDQVNQGTSKGSVFIETMVDGEVVQHVQEEVVSKQGESVAIEKHVEYTSDEGEGKVGEATKVDEQEHAESLASPDIQTTEDSIESKPLIARVVEFFRSLFSWFFA